MRNHVDYNSKIVTIADFLEEAKPVLVQRVMERLDVAGCDALRASLLELVDDLAQSARQGRVDVSVERRYIQLGTDPEILLAKLRALREGLFAQLAERAPTGAVLELGLVAEWFLAIAELVLQQKNRALSILVESVPEHLVLHDRDNRIVFANRAARADVADAIGQLSREPVGQGLGEIPGMEDFAEQTERNFQQAMQGHTVKQQVRFPARGGWRWHEQTVTPVYGGAATVQAVAFVSRDVHERRLAEDRLRLLSKLNAIADSLDQEGALSAIARISVPELADWTVVDLVGAAGLRRHHVAHRDNGQVELAERIARTRPVHGVAQLERFRSGRSILARAGANVPDWADLSASLGPLAALQPSTLLSVPLIVLGELIAVVTFVTTSESKRRYEDADVAVAEDLARRASQLMENARLNQRIQQSEARFRIALAGSEITVLEEDSEGRLRWLYNPQLGPEAGDPIGRRIEDVLSVAEPAAVAATRRRVYQQATRAHVEVDAMVGGARRHLLFSLEAQRSAIGGVIGTAGSIIDMTEAKQAQENLAQALGFRDRMMSILGHDLRTPVAAIQGLAALLMLDGAIADSTREGLRRIDQSVRRMSEMIQTVLDFARTRFQGSIPVAQQRIDLRELCGVVVDELAVAHPKQSIVLLPEVPLVGEWDRARLAQVLSNLVGNALRHGDRKEPVRVSLAGDESQVTVEVTNKGVDIPRDRLERLFDPFAQGDADGAETHKGLGLGLFIAQQIVQSHGGRIAASSADGVITFAVQLPRHPRT